MKKAMLFVLRVIVALFVPAIFVGISVFSFGQTFPVGFVVLFGAMIAQSMLSNKFPKHYAWGKFQNLPFLKKKDNENEILAEEESSKDDLVKLSNVLFNLSKVVLIGAILALIYINFHQRNQFGALGWAITVVVTSITLLFVLLQKRETSYIKLRECLGICTAVAIAVFFYLYFGTFPVLFLFLTLTMSSTLINVFAEISCNLLRRTIFNEFFSLIFSISALLISIISILYQFWDKIWIWEDNLGTYILNVFQYELISGLDLWLMTIILAAIVLIVFRVKAIFRRRQDKKRKKLQAEEDRKMKEEKREKEAKINEERREAIKRELKAIEDVLSKGTISHQQLCFLAQNLDLYSGPLPVLSLVKVEWSHFFQISEIKQQITWKNSLTDVISFFHTLYSSSYKDEELAEIFTLIEELIRKIEAYKEYKGFNTLNNILRRMASDIPCCRLS